MRARARSQSWGYKIFEKKLKMWFEQKTALQLRKAFKAEWNKKKAASLAAAPNPSPAAVRL